ncbi:MAG: amidohydrolase, partial [Gemmatimonadetes bacterium]|nr:amidohydrolase [Gemmatimonadota bacterium]
MKNIFGVFGGCLLFAVLAACGEESAPADLVIMGGRVLTLDETVPEGQAIAVQGNTILAVGTMEEVQRLVGGGTTVIELSPENLVLPGLIDAHGHYMSLGESLMQLDLRSPRTWDEIVALVEDAVAGAQPGDWIVGRGWHQDKWDFLPVPSVEGLPTHSSLSGVSPDNPVMLIHVSGHGAFVNGRALEMMGISSDTPDPEGGEFVRDSSGTPTGMLREAAQDVARAAVAEWESSRSEAEIDAYRRRQVELAGANALENGITEFHDMGASFETIDFFKGMADEGTLPLRIYAHIEEPAERLDGRLPDYRMVGYGDGFLTVRGIGEKVLDGALGVHGGWLLEPYADIPRTSGFNVTPVDDIRRSAELAAEHGFQMAIQGIGDRAARELFDIYEKVFQANQELEDLRWRIEHCQIIHPDDMPRFEELGVIASIRGVFATSDGPWVKSRLGEERTRERGYAYQSMFQSGATVINGTDPPVEDINPIVNFYLSVSRVMENGEVFLPDQRLTREQALA